MKWTDPRRGVWPFPSPLREIHCRSLTCVYSWPCSLSLQTGSGVRDPGLPTHTVESASGRVSPGRDPPSSRTDPALTWDWVQLPRGASRWSGAPWMAAVEDFPLGWKSPQQLPQIQCPLPCWSADLFLFGLIALPTEGDRLTNPLISSHG